MRALILAAIIAVTSPAKVTWLGNSNFNIPTNFRDKKQPCSKETVIFPDRLNAPVRFQSDNFAKEFILPSTGEMLLEGELLLGGEPKEECTEKNKYFIDRSLHYWSQPDVWDSPRFNEATPDAERVPCFDDAVDFPTGTAFSLFLPDMTQYVQEVTVSGEKYSSAFFMVQPKIVNDAQSFFSNSHQLTGVEIGKMMCESQSIKGCPCQENVEPVRCSLKFCAAPVCSSPIKPIGHCCKICGGTISFEREQSFNNMDFKEFVDKIVASYGDTSLVYHVGIVPPNTVQVVIVEKDEYTGMSTLVANDIDSHLLNHWYSGVKNLSLSGSPLSTSGSGVKIAVSMFFAVALVFGGVYAYYYKVPTPKLFVPSMPFGRGSAAGFLSRFDRRTDSVVSLTSRRDSTATVASGVGVSTAFRNPLYDSKRGRVDVIESVDDENM